MWGGKAARQARDGRRNASNGRVSTSSNPSSQQDSQGWNDAHKIESYIKSNFNIYGMYLDDCSVYYSGGRYMDAYLTIEINPKCTSKGVSDAMASIKSSLMRCSTASYYTINIHVERKEYWK